ncbi:hypothetical protein IWZ03DRAFT_38116, partial [Phyllosticta citriasiana]
RLLLLLLLHPSQPTPPRSNIWTIEHCRWPLVRLVQPSANTNTSSTLVLSRPSAADLLTLQNPSSLRQTTPPTRQNGHSINLSLHSILHLLALIHRNQLATLHAPAAHSPPHALSLLVLVDFPFPPPLLIVAVSALAPQPLHSLDPRPRCRRRPQGQRPRRRCRRQQVH